MLISGVDMVGGILAVTYNKIGYTLIEKGLKNYLNNDFNNVYISQNFIMKGSECIRINLESSSNTQSTAKYEQREYSVMLRYYFNRIINNDGVNENIKGKVDRLKKKLLDKRTNSTNWMYLDVDEIEYGIEDDENEDKNIYIVQYDLTLINHNPLN